MAASKSNKGRKIGRNRAKCEAYRRRKGGEGTKTPKRRGLNANAPAIRAKRISSNERPDFVGERLVEIGAFYEGEKVSLNRLVFLQANQHSARREMAKSRKRLAAIADALEAA